MARPLRTVTLAPAQVTMYLRRLGARHQPQYDLPTRRIYSSSAGWIEMTGVAGGHYKLSFYADCPCSG